jgi:hypothetical protein
VALATKFRAALEPIAAMGRVLAQARSASA